MSPTRSGFPRHLTPTVCKWLVLLGPTLPAAKALKVDRRLSIPACDLDRLTSIRADACCCLTLPAYLVAGFATDADDKLPWR